MCRMSAGSGDGGVSVAAAISARLTVVTGSSEGEVGFTPRGSEQHPQKLQFGAHCPPEASVGHWSLQSESPQIAARPLISNERQSTIASPRARSTKGDDSTRCDGVARGTP